MQVQNAVPRKQAFLTPHLSVSAANTFVLAIHLVTVDTSVGMPETPPLVSNHLLHKEIAVWFPLSQRLVL